MDQKFIEPEDDFQYIISETGAYTTYGEITKDINPELLPKNEADYQEFLKLMGLIELGYLD